MVYSCFEYYVWRLWNNCVRQIDSKLLNIIRFEFLALPLVCMSIKAY